ncbi:MAG: hypothetical protein KDD37_08465, partial [Bdellovibrionales bacterium]|nr:hypothetical protein [Bdellovibrionales bacterium]
MGLISIIFLSFISFATPVKAPHVEVDLVSQYDSFIVNDDNYFAFTFHLEPEWHIYWKNPGDSGKEPKVTWLQKDNVEISDFLWPLPSLMPLETLMNYGYGGKIAIPFIIKNMGVVSDKIFVEAKLEWLVCRSECIPGKATLSIELPIKENRQPSKNYNLIHKSLSSIPLKDEQIKTSYTFENGEFIISIHAPEKSIPDFSSVYFFPNNSLQINHSAKQEFEINKKDIILKIKADENVEPNLTSLDGVLSFTPKNTNLDMVAYDVQIAKLGTQDTTTGLPLLLLFAFIGGLILNLMPCVFPVLSLKILGFVHQAQENPKSIRVHGWLYTIGVLCSFWALTIILLSLKASGEAVGWGFQLQSPYFVLGMIFLFFFIGLNLLGFFEFGEKLIQIGGKIKAHGYFSSFQTGVLATIVATPCTAPFMGAAIGVAFTLPLAQTFMIFTSLAMGMAIPYLFLSYFPGWLNLLPKPGQWMLRMKEFFAFPMFCTMLWLLWVFEQQAGATSLFITLLSFICILFLFWIIKHYKKQKVLLAILGTLAVATPFFFITANASNSHTETSGSI